MRTLMANTFSQIYIQTVFAVNGRLSLIKPDFKENLYMLEPIATLNLIRSFRSEMLAGSTLRS